jgi:hypothetical protein
MIPKCVMGTGGVLKGCLSRGYFLGGSWSSFFRCVVFNFSVLGEFFAGVAFGKGSNAFRHGEGILMSANGTMIREGLWLNGEPVNGE